jgi:hypothetical protein
VLKKGRFAVFDHGLDILKRWVRLPAVTDSVIGIPRARSP